MQAIVFMGERKLQLLSFDDPTPGPGEVVLEIKASGMCGSDLKSRLEERQPGARPRQGQRTGDRRT